MVSNILGLTWTGFVLNLSPERLKGEAQKTRPTHALAACDGPCRRGKSLIGLCCFRAVLLSPKKRLSPLLLLITPVSSAPGQACAWRIRPHFTTGCRRMIGGSERGKNVNPTYEKVLIRRTSTSTPLLLSNGNGCSPESLSGVKERVAHLELIVGGWARVAAVFRGSLGTEPRAGL